LTQIFTIASPCRRQNPHRVCSYTKPWLQFEGSAIGGPATGAEAARERDDVNAPKSISGLGVNGEARQGCIRRGLWVLTTASKNFRVLRDPCSLARTVRNGYLALASPAALSGETSDGSGAFEAMRCRVQSGRRIQRISETLDVGWSSGAPIGAEPFVSRSLLP